MRKSGSGLTQGQISRVLQHFSCGYFEETLGDYDVKYAAADIIGECFKHKVWVAGQEYANCKVYLCHISAEHVQRVFNNETLVTKANEPVCTKDHRLLLK